MLHIISFPLQYHMFLSQGFTLEKSLILSLKWQCSDQSAAICKEPIWYFTLLIAGLYLVSHNAFVCYHWKVLQCCFKYFVVGTKYLALMLCIKTHAHLPSYTLAVNIHFMDRCYRCLELYQSHHQQRCTELFQTPFL